MLTRLALWVLDSETERSLGKLAGVVLRTPLEWLLGRG
jgi:hypothetical protein